MHGTSSLLTYVGVAEGKVRIQDCLISGPHTALASSCLYSLERAPLLASALHITSALSWCTLWETPLMVEGREGNSNNKHENLAILQRRLDNHVQCARCKPFTEQQRRPVNFEPHIKLFFCHRPAMMQCILSIQ